MQLVLTGAHRSLSWEPVLLLGLVDEPALDAAIAGRIWGAALISAVPPNVPHSRTPTLLERGEELGVLVAVMVPFAAGVLASSGFVGLGAELRLS